MNKNTLVISAFPACGKSWCFNNLNNKYNMADSDSSNFSWLKNVDKQGNIVKIRNPDFPNNYIEYIKSLIGEKDIVFVSSHKEVRDALKENKIPYVLVYPENTSDNKCLWTQRMIARGSPNNLINLVVDNWNNFIEEMSIEEYPFHYVLGTKENQLFLNEESLEDIIYVWNNIKENDIWLDGTYAEIPVDLTEPWNKK